jgi:hypothetical protein
MIVGIIVLALAALSAVAPGASAVHAHARNLGVYRECRHRPCVFDLDEDLLFFCDDACDMPRLDFRPDGGAAPHRMPPVVFRDTGRLSEKIRDIAVQKTPYVFHLPFWTVGGSHTLLINMCASVPIRCTIKRRHLFRKGVRITCTCQHWGGL